MFEIGDTVQLKSGGPKMTVQRIIGHGSENARNEMQDKLIKMAGYKNGDVICQWFVKTKLESGTFIAEMLEKTQ